MSGLEKGKAAHTKLQTYIDVLVPEADRPYSILFDRLEIHEYFQRRTSILVNGVDYISVSTDVDYTHYLHGLEDAEGDPAVCHIPGNALMYMLQHRMLSLEDDREQFINLRHSLEPTKPMDWVFADEQS